MTGDREEARISVMDVVIEALKGIKSEIFVYAVAMAALLVGSASLGLELLRELKWPLIGLFTAGLIADFFARALPRARVRLRGKTGGG